jgi:CRISPR-associated RAMP protein (TIGR02581 family)
MRLDKAMHKFLLNTLHLKATLRPDGPILIKSGSESAVNPVLPDMNFVRTTNANGQETIYLPGASLKGVIRSHAERIARTLGVDCCDPLDPNNACDSRFQRNSAQDGAATYKKICTACRMFGHTVMASRFFIQDAYPNNPITQLPVRQMVAIDRRSGSSVNTFTMEVATEGEFTVNIVMRNFERWQVGLLALVLRDLREGYLRIGFGKSRGLGQIKLTFDELHLHYTGIKTNDAKLVYLLGAGELVAGDFAAQYGFLRREIPEGTVDFPETAKLGDGWSGAEIGVFGDIEVEKVLKAQVADWRHYVEVYPRS